MSKQDLLIDWVSRAAKSDHLKTEEDIVKYFTKKAGVLESDIQKALEIYNFKSQNNEIPTKWISEFVNFVTTYSASPSPNPETISAYYLNKPLQYLSGIDLVCLEIALSNKGKCIFEDFCKHYIRHNPVFGVVFNTNNFMNFPSYQPLSQHNYKFLYHLLYAYPEVGTIGGPYSYKRQSGVEKHTVISLFHHRNYLIEKALKGGGLAFCFNVFNRIVVNPKFKFKCKPEPDPLLDFDLSFMYDYYSPNSWSSQLNHLYYIPDFSDDFSGFDFLLDLFIYFSTFYLETDCTEQLKRKFENEADIEFDEDSAYDSLFNNYLQKYKYKAMVQFIGAVQPLLLEYSYKWIPLLTCHLTRIANGAYIGCAEIVMKAGAKINLSKKIPNKQFCDVITEALEHRTNGIKILIEIFQNATKEEFGDDMRRINESQIVAMFRYYPTTQRELKQLKSVLLCNDFALTEQAKNTLQAQVSQPY